MAGNSAALARIDEMESQYIAMKGRLGKAKQEAKKAVENTSRTFEVAAGGFVGGFAEAYLDDGEILGFPALLAIGVGGHVAAYMLDDETGKHIRNFADGGLAAFGATKGREMATEWISKGRGAKGGAKTSGSGGSRGLSQDEFDKAFRR